jgi:uncharacterized membrane protein YgdD (TMEM256/DUF423 family)
MPNQKKTALVLAFCLISIAISIALDAFGAHGLKSILSEKKLEVFHKANRYLMLQNMGAVLILLLKSTNKFNIKNLALVILLIGTWIFSLSLYAVSFSELYGMSQHLRYAGAIAPIGGTLMIMAWVLLAQNVLSSYKNENSDSAQTR